MALAAVGRNAPANPGIGDGPPVSSRRLSSPTPAGPAFFRQHSPAGRNPGNRMLAEHDYVENVLNGIELVLTSPAPRI